MNPYSPPAAPGPFAVAPYPGAPAAVSDLTVDLLRRTRPWVLFVAALAFVASGLIVTLAVITVAAGFLASSGPDAFPKFLGLLYLPLALLYVYPGIKLWKYGSAIGRLVASRIPAELEAALAEQKSFWKYVGVTAAVVLVLYAVGIGVAIMVGVVAAMKGGS
jgi:hypothetical protein